MGKSHIQANKHYLKFHPLRGLIIKPTVKGNKFTKHPIEGNITPILITCNCATVEQVWCRTTSEEELNKTAPVNPPTVKKIFFS
jgi:hypothetical protein